MRSRHRRIMIASLAVIAALTAGHATVVAARGPANDAAMRGGSAHASHPVLVELYHSQGCSSCPPAEANVNAIAGRRDVVALSFAVTYWDYLGWKDRFASPQFTARQQDFARAKRSGYVATPQIWINGRTTLVGNDGRAQDDAIRAAQTDGPAIALTDCKAMVSAGIAPATGADVWVAQFDPRTVQVAIEQGENGGRTLPMRNVVHALIKLERWSGPASSYALPAAPAGQSSAVFIQAGSGGPVLATMRN